MKRLKLCIVVLLSMVMFGGCAKTIDLTEEETNMFAEYISKEVLARDKNYDQELLAIAYNTEETDPEEAKDNTVENTVDKEVTQAPTNKDQVVTTQPAAEKNEKATIDDVLGTTAVFVSYHSSKMYSSYPEGSDKYFVIAANDGYQLCVVRFGLKNTTNKSVAYNMLSESKESIEYKLTMDGGNSYSPLLTLLVDDLQFINTVIPANKTEQGVLVFRIPEKEANSKGTLSVVDGSKSATVEIK